MLKTLNDRQALAASAGAVSGARTPELQLLYETAPIGLAFLTPDCRYQLINRRLCEICGISVDDHIGRSVRETVPQVAEQVENIVQTILRTGKSITGIEVSGQRPDGGNAERVWITNWYPLIATDGSILGINVASEEITERKRMEAALAASKAESHELAVRLRKLNELLEQRVVEIRQRDNQMRAILDALPAAVYTTDAEGVITYYNRAAVDLAGREPALGKDKWCVTLRIHTPDGRLLPHDQCPMALALKEKRPVRGVEAMAERPDGTLIPFLPFPTPITNEDGELVGAVNMLVDITERKRAEERQKLLVAELDHRVKNILAQVAVVAKSTRQGSQSIDEFLQSLDGRIGSMATAHGLLSDGQWQGVGLAALVRSQLAPYATGANIEISGTDLALTAAETQAVAMVLHELVTNAAKYGALSVPEGQVSVSWNRQPNGDATAILMLEWRELGGPPITTEVQSGYGTGLIRDLVPHELGGKVDLVFDPGGLNCRIAIPLKRLEQR
jgi:PAS domain S-box-containing protein